VFPWNPGDSATGDPTDPKVYAFKGLFRIISIADVLTILQAGMKSGSLICSFAGKTALLYLEDGRLVYASAPNEDAEVMQWLASRKGLGAEAISEAAREGLDGLPLLRRLRELEVLDDADLESFVRDRILRLIKEILCFGEGEFEFVEGKAAAEPLVTVKLEVPFAVMLALQAIDEGGGGEASTAGGTEPVLELDAETVAFEREDLEKVGIGVAPSPGAVARLVHVYNGRRIRTYTLGSGSRYIGRGESADIRLTQDRTVSRFHARISGVRGRFMIEDLDSVNGVLVNGTPVRRCELRHGDEIVVGSHLLLFELVESPPES
jgi:hypothetical protein